MLLKYDTLNTQLMYELITLPLKVTLFRDSSTLATLLQMVQV